MAAANPSPGFTDHRFYSSLRALRVGSIVAVSGTAAWALFGVGGEYEQMIAELFASIFALHWIAFEVARWFYWVGVGPRGLRAYNRGGAYSRVEWGEITACRRECLLPRLPYLVIGVGEQSRELTIPIYLEDYPRFRDLVLSYAPSENPMSQFLTQGSDLVE